MNVGEQTAYPLGWPSHGNPTGLASMEFPKLLCSGPAGNRDTGWLRALLSQVMTSGMFM